jgi:hypothetical protein
MSEQQSTAREAVEAAGQDALIYGTGYAVVRGDGSGERIDPQQVTPKPARVLDAARMDAIEAMIGLSLGKRSFPTALGVEGWEWRLLLAAARRGLAADAAGPAGTLAMPEALLRQAHACMRECGWQLAPASDDGSDGVLQAAVAEVEARFGELLGPKP